MTKKIEVQKTEVVSIKLRIKGKEIDLSLEEAKELKDELNKVFAEPVKEYVPYYPYYPTYPWWGIYPPSDVITPEITWTIGTGDVPQKLPYIYCSPNTTVSTSGIDLGVISYGDNTILSGQNLTITCGGNYDIS
jgi:hypothetical protein